MENNCMEGKPNNGIRRSHSQVYAYNDNSSGADACAIPIWLTSGKTSSTSRDGCGAGRDPPPRRNNPDENGCTIFTEANEKREPRVSYQRREQTFRDSSPDSRPTHSSALHRTNACYSRWTTCRMRHPRTLAAAGLPAGPTTADFRSIFLG